MVALQAVVDAQSAGLRLDVFLTRRFSENTENLGLSRAGIQRLITAGRVTVNGEKAKSGTRLKVHDRVELEPPPPTESSLKPEAIALTVLYEDRDFIVIDKPAGLVVHPAAAVRGGTLVNALLHHCPDLAGIGGERRPGIVHRLDKDTSGVMVVAKNSLAFQELARQFKDRTVGKEYVAVVWGEPETREGVIDRPIGRHRSDRKRMSSTRSLSRKREAITEWAIERSFSVGPGAATPGKVSLLRLIPRTGRTHQIRVHLADSGHPLIGDKIYGYRLSRPSALAGKLQLLHNFPRHALHAEKLTIIHPRTHVRMQFKAPLPKDLLHLVESLEEKK